MRQLDRKLLRDLLQMKGQSLAISLVIASGVATFVMSLSTLESLKVTQETYYERYRFSDVFAQMKRAPKSLEIRIAEIPGVKQLQTRIVMDVTLDVRDLAEPAVGRLISIPDRRTPGLNELHLRNGRYIEPGRKGEVLASEAFAEAHGFQPGDTVRAVINGKLEVLTIVGVALSPEYIFQMRGGDVVPDDRRFGVFWMGYEQLANAFDMDGAFNSVTLTMMRGASEAEILKRLDQLTEPYGGIGAYGRSDQISHRFLSDEIKGLRGMGLVAPLIFLSVAGFLLNVVISRLITTQREQIAALKAFGYTKFEVGLHYLKFVLLITSFGVVLGIATGVWLGRGLTELYTQFYRFPVFFFHFDARVACLALFLSFGAAILGTLSAVRRAVKLPPAEAMRPEPPASFRPTLIERMGLQRFIAQSARMILRQLERKPLKSLLSSFGISLAVSILVLGNFMEDALDALIEFEFHTTQRQDVSISFIEPTSFDVVHEVGHLPGVMKYQEFRSLPVRLRFGHRSRRLGIMGFGTGSNLFRLMDADENEVSIPENGLLLSEKLAELLAVTVGDRVTIEVLEQHRPVHELAVTGLISDYSGTNAYMNMQALHRLMREGNSVSGAFLSVDADRIDKLYTTLKETPRVAGVTVKDAALKSFDQTIAENQRQMKAFNVMFACIIAFGVIYNTARISLSERSRELATLRVIGFTRGEISMILLGELAVLTLAALPLGMAVGYGFAGLTVWAFSTEMFRLPMVVSSSTFAFAATVTILSSIVSGLVVRRRLDHLDLVAVLKSRE